MKLEYPLTEAAQDVPGTFTTFQAYRDEQAARLYRHGCRMESDRRKLIKALQGLFEHCAMVHKHWGEGSNRVQADAAQNFAAALLRELGEQP